MIHTPAHTTIETAPLPRSIDQSIQWCCCPSAAGPACPPPHHHHHRPSPPNTSHTPPPTEGDNGAATARGLVLGNEPLLRHVLTHFLGLYDQLLHARGVARCVEFRAGWVRVLGGWGGWTRSIRFDSIRSQRTYPFHPSTHPPIRPLHPPTHSPTPHHTLVVLHAASIH